MHTLLGYSEINTMITYEDLQNAAEEASEKKFSHAEILRKCVGNFIEYYHQSLAIAANPTFCNHKGEEMQIITLGVSEHNVFKEKYLHELKLSDDFTLSFMLKTVIAMKGVHHTWIASPITISMNSDVVTFTFNDNSETKSCRIPQGNTLAIYSEAADMLKMITMNIIKQTAPK
ncbi:hypothetical protein [Xenorhabdus miraniensis]|uniref:Uncharacterized protein n=1 Tax=Xenorhabdus miraniensis TaxID=351674 RepID=A0A2D0JLG4_9GAMM|nr:hypothetical protein [Xenorhabdus miraniensis]PHM47148.1 hypothetical protein Xmir_03570 [Xenorhabdus miraniensis]